MGYIELCQINDTNKEFILLDKIVRIGKCRFRPVGQTNCRDCVEIYFTDQTRICYDITYEELVNIITTRYNYGK